MHVHEAMRGTPGIRDFTDAPVPPEVIHRVLDAARYAPSGMNRQPWRVVVVDDVGQRKSVGEIFSRVWDALVVERVRQGRMDPNSRIVTAGTRFARSFADVPVHLVVWVDSAAIDVTDEHTQSPSIVAGSSVFPFVQNVLLASRAEGIGTRLTTLLAREPDALHRLLRVPDGYALGCVIAMGYPMKWSTPLTRRSVGDFATWNRFDGSPVLAQSDQSSKGESGRTATARTSGQ